MKRYLNHSLVDNVGACLSFTCAIHCMATPLLITVLPLVGLGFFLSESVELVIIAVTAGLAVGSLTWGYRHHRKWRIFLTLGGAFLCIFIAHFQVSEQYESVFMACGGLLLMVGHLLNRRLCRACQYCKTSKWLWCFLFSVLLINAVGETSFARNFSLSGQVINAETRTPLVDVRVSLSRKAEGTSVFRTDKTGQFRFDEIASGTYTIRFACIGYETVNREIDVKANLPSITVELKRIVFQLKEILVKPTNDELDAFEKTTNLVLFGRQLGQRMGTTIADTLSDEVGVAQRSMGRAVARPVLRGMSGNRLLILEDGERTGDKSASSADHAVAIDPTTARNIEIIRGPASLLYGSNTLGGVVNVKRETIPQTLPNRPTVSFTFQSESVNSGLTGATGVTFPIGDLAWRLKWNRRRADDTRTPVGILENTSLSNTNFSSGASMVKDWGHIGISGGAYRSDYGIPGSPEGHIKGVHIALDRQRYEGTLEYVLQQQSVLEKLKLQTVYTRYQHQEFESNNTLGVEFGVLTYNVSALAYLQNDVVIGVWGEYRDHATGGFYWTPHTREMAVAGFCFNQKEFNNFTLQGAIRGEIKRVEPFRAGSSIRAGTVRQRNFGGVSGAVSGIYHWNDNLKAGTTLMKTFLAPGIEELFSDGPHLAVYSYEIGNADLDSEEGYGTEAFIRYSDTRVRLNLAIFRNQILNYLIPTNTGEKDWGSGAAGWLWIYQYQGQDATLDGAEFSIDTEIIPRFHAQMNLSYLKGSLTSSGLPLERIPPLNGTVALRYITKPINLHLTARFSDDQNRLGELEVPTHGYIIYALGVQFLFTMWDLHHQTVLGIENILNTEYRQHLSRIKSVMPEPGRNVKFLYRLNF